jgi:hypothetical protein
MECEGCYVVEIYRPFGLTYCFHLQDETCLFILFPYWLSTASHKHFHATEFFSRKWKSLNDWGNLSPPFPKDFIVFVRFSTLLSHLYPAHTHTLELSHNLLPHFSTVLILHCLQVFPLKF